MSNPGPPPKGFCDPTDVSLLAEPLRSIVAQIIHDAPTGGIVPVSLVRTPYMQWLLRHERTPGHEWGPMSLYPGHPRTALPGVKDASGRWVSGSKHQRGEAADLGGRDMPWLRAHLDDYGVHLAVPGENWHIEVRPGAKPRVPITPFGQHTDPNAGRKWLPIRPGDTDKSIYARGGFDNEVSELQIRLKKRGFYKGKVDGDNGPATQAAIVAMKAWTIAIQKAYHRPVWPNTDPIVGPATIEWLRQVTA